jgi:hypothetical protein|tara:strand:- start:1966 stop:2145 length:180 start_codon:yes stop_codon:yes gene_type:complete
MVNKNNMPSFSSGSNSNKVKRIKGSGAQGFSGTEQRGTKVTLNASKMGSGTRVVKARTK